MTTTFDPTHPAYVDEHDVRSELTRVFAHCGGCRRCVDRCGAFPTLFEMIDRRTDGDAGRLTPVDQDRVVGECFQCGQCSAECPYAPDRHAWQIDVPRLVVRARAMQHAQRLEPVRARLATQLLVRTGALGRLGTALAPLANRIVAAPPRSFRRRVLASLTGISASAVLPPFASVRFSTWFARRPPVVLADRRATVTVFPTCLVEYRAPGIGADVVRVYERNGVECAGVAGGCCGAPLLHAGRVDRFRAVATRTVRHLAREIRDGRDVVVAQAACAAIIIGEYPAQLTDPDLRGDVALVAAHTHDATGYLLRPHTAGTAIDTDFEASPHARIAYQGPCDRLASGPPVTELLQLTGAAVQVVDGGGGLDQTWGLRAIDDAGAEQRVERSAQAVVAAGADVVVGDDHVTALAVGARSGRPVAHPLQVIARAYGFPETP